MSGVVVLGAGMAGLGAAWRLRGEDVAVTVVDRNPYPGGHAASFASGSFVFDEGPHVSFTRDPRLQGLFSDSVGGEFEILRTRVDNHWKGHWIKHPAQCNLHGLPTDLVVRVIRDFVEAERADAAGGATNYAEWLVATYGRTFAETFPMAYGRKYHTAPAAEMTTDWLGPRLYRPSLDEVLRGALEPSTPDVHYVDHFRYPKRGGFVSFLRGFVDAASLELDREVVAIDPGERRLAFRDGTGRDYDALVSSLPLPILIDLLDRDVAAPEGPPVGRVPAEVRDAAGRLSCTRCVLVDLGVDREDLSESHWTYFYDDDFVFTRVSFPHLFSRSTVPPGAGSIQVEIYRSDKYRPLEAPAEAFVEPALRDLRRCGLLREDDRILHRSAKAIRWANVVFDHDRPAALGTIFGYLAEIGVATCGRYGRWGYHWTDESFLSGESAAEEALDRL